MVVPFRITFVNNTGSPESFKYTKPLIVPVCCCANATDEKSRTRVKNILFMAVNFGLI
jgi:hypothetical protein